MCSRVLIAELHRQAIEDGLMVLVTEAHVQAWMKSHYGVTSKETPKAGDAMWTTAARELQAQCPEFFK